MIICTEIGVEAFGIPPRTRGLARTQDREFGGENPIDSL
jgi:hypothetical protein